MSTVKRLGPELEIDENGKLRCLPFQIPPEYQSKGNSANKRSATKKCINFPLQRMIFDPAELEDSPKHLAKVRKVDKIVRKELFKVPQCSIPARSYRQRTSSRPSSNRKSSQRNFQQGIAPLPDSETKRSNTITRAKVTKGYLFQSPSKPVINFIKQNKEKVKFANTLKKTPQKNTDKPHISPDSEFLELEKTCATPKSVRSFASPSAAICNLLANTVISEEQINQKTETQSLGSVIETVRSIIAGEEDDFQMMVKIHENRMSQLRNALKSLEDFDLRNKENAPTRRSGRLAARHSANSSENIHSLVKASTYSSDAVFVTSPTISKGVDLRKAALSNNLARNIQLESMTPRGHKAINMYNSMRNDFPFLCTPKPSANTPKKQSGTGSISKVLQSQLLLLQETPSHN